MWSQRIPSKSQKRMDSDIFADVSGGINRRRTGVRSGTVFKR
jgi:hypothetical protein